MAAVNHDAEEDPDAAPADDFEDARSPSKNDRSPHNSSPHSRRASRSPRRTTSPRANANSPRANANSPRANAENSPRANEENSPGANEENSPGANSSPERDAEDLHRDAQDRSPRPRLTNGSPNNRSFDDAPEEDGPAVPTDPLAATALEELEAMLQKCPSHLDTWLHYTQRWERLDEGNALSVYAEGVRKCGHIDLWVQYLRFCQSRATVRAVLAVFHAAIPRIGSDHAAGELYIEYIALLKGLWNYQVEQGDELDLDEGEGREHVFDGAPRLSLSPPEQQAIAWVGKKSADDGWASVRSGLGLEVIQKVLTKALTEAAHEKMEELLRVRERFDDETSGFLAADVKHAELVASVKRGGLVYKTLVELYEKVDTRENPLQGGEVAKQAGGAQQPGLALKWVELVEGCR